VPAPTNLPAALFGHAASSPEEPWLFRAEGWDWRWHSWGEIAQQVLARAESLSASAAGSRVTFPYAAQPEEIVLDLAIQAAGLVAAPTSDPPPGPSPLASLPPPPFPPHRERGKKQEQSRTYFETSPSSPGEGGREGAGEEGRGGEGGGGAVVIRSGQPVELSAADLIALAGRIQELIEPIGKRDIVVLGGPLENPDERAMLSWATLSGAAVVLEPNPVLRVATAAWTRPTVFHGTAAELAVLRDWAVREKRGWLRRSPRLPFRRLRTVLVTGPEALGQEEKEFWEGRGVRVAGLSAMS
jgi:hypothetical protein